MNRLCLVALAVLALTLPPTDALAQQISEKQRAQLLKRFPAADANKDGKLSNDEIQKFARRMRPNRGGGVPRTFKANPGWKAERFPEDAVCYKSPEEIKAVYQKVLAGRRQKNARAVTSYEKPTDGSLRIVGTGHSFMAPGYQTFPIIARTSGLKQPALLTHTGGGMTGSSRYKWEQENGIFQFDGKPTPKLLASIANAKWDAMMFGPYYQDQPEYYACWIDFCLKYNPHMKFYISDAWPQLEQFEQAPKSEDEMTYEVMKKLGANRNIGTAKIVTDLNKKYPNKVFVMPTSDAMVLAVREFHRGNLPGVEGLHKAVGGKSRSLWRDKLGHLGPGFGDLEGYVFYATIYGKSPELIKKPLTRRMQTPFPSPELDRVFKKIAWEAVTNNPLSGVKPAKVSPAQPIK